MSDDDTTTTTGVALIFTQTSSDSNTLHSKQRLLPSRRLSSVRMRVVRGEAMVTVAARGASLGNCTLSALCPLFLVGCRLWGCRAAP